MKAKNVWKRFYEEVGLSVSESKDWSRWRDRIRCRADCRLAIDLFALARYEAEQDIPLNLESVAGKEGVARTVFGFGYDELGKDEETRLKLRDQLLRLGVQLLRTDKQFQYLRTINKLSGAFYLKAAAAIRTNRIPIEKWITDGGNLSEPIANSIRPFIRGKEDPTSDVVSFFRNLKAHFERYNAPPSAELFFRDENMLSKAMLNAILKELGWSEDNAEDTEESAKSDTRPFLCLDSNSKLVVKFPTKNCSFDVNDEATLVLFEYKDAEGRTLGRARFRKNGEKWDPDQHVEKGIPVDDLAKVERSVWNKAKKEILPRLDVTPEVLRDFNVNHILFGIDPPREGTSPAVRKLFHPEESLRSDNWYFVAALHRWTPDVAIISDGEEETIPLCKPFPVPAKAESIRVGTTEYPVKTKALNWIDPDGCRWRTGGRLFCERKANPFSEELACQTDIRVAYRKRDGTETPLSFRHCTVPDAILWDRGWIVFKNPDGSEIAKQALTFIPDIDDSAILHDFDLDEKGSCSIRIGGETILVDVKPLETMITLPPEKVHGFNHLSFALNRRGFSFRVPGVDADIVIPISTDENSPTKVARDDFLAATISGASDGNGTVDIQGRDKVTRPRTKIKMRDIEMKAGCPDDGIWSISDQSGLKAFWQIYDPEKTRMPFWEEKSRHPVYWQRQGDDLCVRFWIANLWRSRKLVFLFYPAHRQDEGPKVYDNVETTFWVQNEVEQEGDQLYATFETAIIKGLYSDPSIDWGCGLLSFVGFD